MESLCEEWDLGVLVDSSLKFSHQCVKAGSKASKTLGMIKRIFTNKDANTITPWYKSIIRPKLK